MIAERYENDYRQTILGPSYTAPRPGNGQWWRPLGWFSDTSGYRRDHHIRIPFAVATLERGLALFEEKELVSKIHITTNPVTGRRIESGRRNLYTNKFHNLAESTLTDAQLNQLLLPIEKAPF